MTKRSTRSSQLGWNPDHDNPCMTSWDGCDPDDMGVSPDEYLEMLQTEILLVNNDDDEYDDVNEDDDDDDDEDEDEKEKEENNTKEAALCDDKSSKFMTSIDDDTTIQKKQRQQKNEEEEGDDEAHNNNDDNVSEYINLDDQISCNDMSYADDDDVFPQCLMSMTTMMIKTTTKQKNIESTTKMKTVTLNR